MAWLKNQPEQFCISEAAPTHYSHWKSMQQSAGADNSSWPVKRQVVLHSPTMPRATLLLINLLLLILLSDGGTIMAIMMKHQWRPSGRTIYTWEQHKDRQRPPPKKNKLKKGFKWKRWFLKTMLFTG